MALVYAAHNTPQDPALRQAKELVVSHYLGEQFETSVSDGWGEFLEMQLRNVQHERCGLLLQFTKELLIAEAESNKGALTSGSDEDATALRRDAGRSGFLHQKLPQTTPGGKGSPGKVAYRALLQRILQPGTKSSFHGSWVSEPLPLGLVPPFTEDELQFLEQKRKRDKRGMQVLASEATLQKFWNELRHWEPPSVTESLDARLHAAAELFRALWTAGSGSTTKPKDGRKLLRDMPFYLYEFFIDLCELFDAFFEVLEDVKAVVGLGAVVPLAWAVSGENWPISKEQDGTAVAKKSRSVAERDLDDARLLVLCDLMRADLTELFQQYGKPLCWLAHTVEWILCKFRKSKKNDQDWKDAVLAAPKATLKLVPSSSSSSAVIKKADKNRALSKPVSVAASFSTSASSALQPALKIKSKAAAVPTRRTQAARSTARGSTSSISLLPVEQGPVVQRPQMMLKRATKLLQERDTASAGKNSPPSAESVVAIKEAENKKSSNYKQLPAAAPVAPANAVLEKNASSSSRTAERELCILLCALCEDPIAHVYLGKCSAGKAGVRLRMEEVGRGGGVAPGHHLVSMGDEKEQSISGENNIERPLLVAAPLGDVGVLVSASRSTSKAVDRRNKSQFTTTVGVHSSDDQKNWERILAWAPERKIRCPCRMDTTEDEDDFIVDDAVEKTLYKFRKGQDLKLDDQEDGHDLNVDVDEE
ncbi:unnamed protein product [Amoebophrya sp. A120]|nr:unnamed protein product [Amoebophrya sp. A120]|eukprot:GSA120T00025128001.1